MGRGKFRRTADGLVVSLRPDERAGLHTILGQFRQLLVEGKGPSLIRFQPPVHIHDRKASDEFWGMVGDALLRHRLEAIDTVESGLGGAALDDDGVAAWMQTLNSMRLYLGQHAGGGGSHVRSARRGRPAPGGGQVRALRMAGRPARRTGGRPQPKTSRPAPTTDRDSRPNRRGVPRTE